VAKDDPWILEKDQWMAVKGEILTMELGGLDACGCLDAVYFWESGVGVRSISALCNSSSPMHPSTVGPLFCPSILFAEVAKENQYPDQTMLSLFDPSESYLKNLDI
jgi:hypothetical protein